MTTSGGMIEQSTTIRHKTSMHWFHAHIILSQYQILTYIRFNALTIKLMPRQVPDKNKGYIREFTELCTPVTDLEF